MEACENCKFFHLKEEGMTDGGTSTTPMCRRYPEEIRVGRKHWCGEHQPKPAPKPEPKQEPKKPQAKKPKVNRRKQAKAKAADVTNSEDQTNEQTSPASGRGHSGVPGGSIS